MRLEPYAVWLDLYAVQVDPYAVSLDLYAVWFNPYAVSVDSYAVWVDRYAVSLDLYAARVVQCGWIVRLGWRTLDTVERSSRSRIRGRVSVPLLTATTRSYDDGGADGRTTGPLTIAPSSGVAPA